MNRRLSNAQLIVVAVSLPLAVGAGIAIPLIDSLSTTGVMVTALIASAAGTTFAIARRSPFAMSIWHPLFMPLIYITLVSLAPILFVESLNIPLGLVNPDNLVPRTIIVMALTVAGYASGVALGLIPLVLPNKWRAGQNETASLDDRYLANMGMLLLIVSCIGRLAIYLPEAGQAYTNGQNSSSLAISINTIVGGLILVAVSMLTFGNRPLHRTFSSAQWILFSVYIIVTLLSGSRSTVIAPIIVVAFTQHFWVRPIPTAKLLIAAVVMIVALQYVGEVRGHTGTTQFIWEGGVRDATIQVLSPLVSPIYLTNQIVQRVPNDRPYFHGSTYLAALQRQIPGPIARVVLGPPRGTGSNVYREIMNDYNQASGFSFSFPTEAYLNFGLSGTFVVSSFVGILFGLAWRIARQSAMTPAALLYPLLVGNLPYGFRSDALTQIKLVLYPMIVLCVAYAVARHRSSVAQERLDYVDAVHQQQAHPTFKRPVQS